MIAVKKLTPEEWAQCAADAHLAVFTEEFRAETDRSTYVLLTVDTETDQPLQYATIRELDSESVYINYGGSFPSARGTPKSLNSFKAILEWMSESYKRVSFMTENNNFPMLKLAMNQGFRIVGIRCFDNHLMLEHHLEFGRAA